MDDRTVTARWRSPRAQLALLLLVGALAHLPSLRMPLWLDDYLHLSMVHGTYPAPRGPFDLYDFVGDADRQAFLDRGLLPWWSHPRLTLRFFRPLSSALLWADYRAFSGSSTIMHAHSLAWWALAVIAVWLLLRRSFSGRVALLGGLVFAVAPCHAVPLAWIANREALVALALGCFALIAYARWRESGRNADGALAFALFALTFLAGEYGIGFGGYVLAYEIVRRREAIARRARGLAVFVVPLAAYLLVRARLHYGAMGSGSYRDPIAEPLRFLAMAPRRMATLLLEAWWTLDLDQWGSGTSRWALVLAIGGSAAALALPVRRALASLEPRARADATWLLLGSVLALPPVLAVAPSMRLLGVSAIGVAAVVAVVLDRAWFPRQSEPRHGVPEAAGLVALLLAFAHLVHAPMISWAGARGLREMANDFASRAAWTRTRVSDPADARVVVVRASWQTTLFGAVAIDPVRAQPPRVWRVLAQSGHLLALRTDARTIDLVAAKGSSVYPWEANDLFRSSETPLAQGATVVLPDVTATVLEADERGPHRVRFTFDRDLDDASLTWIIEGSSEMRDAPPPKPGFGEPFDP